MNMNDVVHIEIDVAGRDELKYDEMLGLNLDSKMVIKLYLSFANCFLIASRTLILWIKIDEFLHMRVYRLFQ